MVLIVADDLGSGDLGSYGQKIIRTPQLDALASRGIRFTDAYSGSPVCAPSRAVLLTGLHTGHAPIRDNKEIQPEGQEPLPADAVTIARVLKTRGYATAAIGKWGLGAAGSSGDPLRHGFDHFYGYLCQRHAHNHYPAYLYRDGVREPIEGNREKYASGAEAGATYAPDLLRKDAAAFIHSHADGPYFLLFATPVPHLALQVPAESMEPYAIDVPDAPYDGKRGYLSHPTPRRAYAAMVSRLDRDVGELVDLVRSLPSERDTLIIFTSDNGPTIDVGGADSTFFDSAAGLRGRKMSLHEGGVRVPLIIAWASGRVTGESRIAVGSWDLMPTIAELCGAAAPAGIDGLSLAGLVRGDAAPAEHEFLYWEYPAGGGSQAVRLGSYKGVRKNVRKTPGGPIELYDLSLDRSESHDIAAAHPDVVEKIRSIMAARAPALLPEWNY